MGGSISQQMDETSKQFWNVYDGPSARTRMTSQSSGGNSQTSRQSYFRHPARWMSETDSVPSSPAVSSVPSSSSSTSYRYEVSHFYSSMSSCINISSSKTLQRQPDLTVLSTLPFPPSTYEATYGPPPPAAGHPHNAASTSSTPTEHQHTEQPLEYIEFDPKPKPPVEKITDKKLLERVTKEFVATVLIQVGLESEADQYSKERHNLVSDIFLALENEYFDGQSLSVTWVSIA